MQNIFDVRDPRARTGESAKPLPAPEPLGAEAVPDGARPSLLVYPASELPPAPLHEVLDRTAHARLIAATAGLSPASAWLAWLDWAIHLAVSPGKNFELMAEAAQGALRSAGASVPSHAPLMQNDDPRFAHPGWETWPFNAYRYTFACVEAWWKQAASGVRGVEAHHERVVQFFARQCLDAIAPSNFVLTNPHVLDTAMGTGGANFASGARNWLEDFIEWFGYARGPIGKPKPSYRPGHEVATTPGKVVWRGRLCELLQYAPATPDVEREPIVIVPSWIMKYYVLDLQPHNSLVRYLVAAGYTVFMISWRNPDERFRDVSLDDYLREGLLAALDVVRE
ncbi:MAG TPA: poly-beta-hydroxybutyrate polymerase N-terminal domain-containing protein, partial [Trinickia sp.]|uniref:poly-beta-hydroxybutyrate polymerase N-terminal domain-containing protein n=1 Tax=Trinickia sp. TaxID=2571163 RepID=UPI002B642393